MSKMKLPTEALEARFCSLEEIPNPPTTKVELPDKSSAGEKKVQLCGFVQGDTFRAKLFAGKKNLLEAQVHFEKTWHTGYITQIGSGDDKKWKFFEAEFPRPKESKAT